MGVQFHAEGAGEDDGQEDVVLADEGAVVNHVRKRSGAVESSGLTCRCSGKPAIGVSGVTEAHLEEQLTEEAILTDVREELDVSGVQGNLRRRRQRRRQELVARPRWSATPARAECLGVCFLASIFTICSPYSRLSWNYKSD